jgi:hypothetical protein
MMIKRLFSILLVISIFSIYVLTGFKVTTFAEDLTTIEGAIAAANNASSQNYSATGWAKLQAALTTANSISSATTSNTYTYATQKAPVGSYLSSNTTDNYVHLSTTVDAYSLWIKNDTSGSGATELFSMINSGNGLYMYMSTEKTAAQNYICYVKVDTLVNIKANALLNSERWYYGNPATEFDLKSQTQPSGIQPRIVYYRDGKELPNLYTWGSNTNPTLGPFVQFTQTAATQTQIDAAKDQALSGLVKAFNLDATRAGWADLMASYKQANTLSSIYYPNDPNDFKSLQAALGSAAALMSGDVYNIQSTENISPYPTIYLRNGEASAAGDGYAGYQNTLDTSDLNQVWYKTASDSSGYFQLINAGQKKYMYLSDEKNVDYATDAAVNYSFYLKFGYLSDLSTNRTKFCISNLNNMKSMILPSGGGSAAQEMTVDPVLANKLTTWSSYKQERAVTFLPITPSETMISDLKTSIDNLYAARDLTVKSYTKSQIQTLLDTINEFNPSIFTTQSWNALANEVFIANAMLTETAYRIVKVNTMWDDVSLSGLVLTPISLNNGFDIGLSPKNDSDTTQFWYKIKTTDGYYMLLNVGTLKILYITNTTTTNNINIDYSYFVNQNDISNIVPSSRAEFKDYSTIYQNAIEARYNASIYPQYLTLNSKTAISTTNTVSNGNVNFEQKTMSLTQSQTDTLGNLLDHLMQDLKANTTSASADYKAQLQVLMTSAAAERDTLDINSNSLYTPESRQTITDFINTANANMATTNNGDINSMIINLTNAVKCLIGNDAKAVLFNAVGTVNNMSQGNFSTDTWNALMASYAIANPALQAISNKNNTTYTNDMITAITADILLKLSYLKSPAVTPPLAALIRLLKNRNFKESNFTADTFATFTSDYATAQNLLNDPNANQGTVDDITRSLIIDTNNLKPMADGDVELILSGQVVINKQNIITADGYDDGYADGFNVGLKEFAYQPEAPKLVKNDPVENITNTISNDIAKNNITTKNVAPVIDWTLIYLAIGGGGVLLLIVMFFAGILINFLRLKGKFAKESEGK